MLLLDRWRGRTIVLLPLLAFLLIEQTQLAAPLHLDRAAHLQMLADAGAPPAWCDTFAVVSARQRVDYAEGDRIAAGWGEKNGRDLFDIYRHNVDAMLLSSYYDRPTINGNSTFNPPDWNFARPEAPDYPDRLRYYARRHPVGRLCVLDRRRTPQWSALPYSAAGGAGSRR